MSSDSFQRPYPQWLDKLPEEVRDQAIEAFNGRFTTDLQPAIDNKVTVSVPNQAPPPPLIEEETSE